MRLPDPIANTTTEAYLAYKAGVLAEGDLKPKLYEPYIHLDAWLAYWTGLTTTYPVKNVGKNLLQFIPKSGEGMTTTYDMETGMVHVSGTNSSHDGKWSNISKTVDCSLPAGTYSFSVTEAQSNLALLLRLRYQDGTNWDFYIPKNSTSLTFTTTKDATRMYIWYGALTPAYSSVDFTVGLQLEAGSEATSFEPYTGEPEMLTDEEAYIAYLSGVTDAYPEEFRDPADIRVAAYLRYLISGRWGRPEYPVTNEELYLSMLKTKYIPSGDPSSDIEINGTAKAPFVDVKMYGDTFQQTYTGKNLLGASLATMQSENTGGTWSNGAYTRYGVTVTPVFSNGLLQRIELSGTATSNFTFIVSKSYSKSEFEAIVTAGETYTLSGCPSGGSPTTYYLRVLENPYKNLYTDTGEGITKQMPSISSGATQVRLLIGVDRGTNATGLVYRPQFEKSASATTYEPYVGGVPSPNPDYPQQIQTVTGEQVVEIVGKNLIDPDGLELGNIDASGNDSASQKVVRSGYIRVAAGNYTLKVNNSDNNTNLWRYAIYDNSKTFVSANTPQAKSATITIANNGYIRVSFYNVPWKDLTVQEIIDSQVQLELGSTATAYAPYSKQTLPINLGSIELCKLDTYQDYIWKDGDDWKVHKAMSKVLIDGTVGTISSPSTNRFNLDKCITDYKKLANSSFALCDQYISLGQTDNNAQFNTNASSYECCINFGSATANVIRFKNTKISTSDDFADALENHPLTMYYALAAPTDTVITNQTLVAQLEAIRTALLQNGANTITNTAAGSNLAGDMEIGYYGYNPRNRYDKFIWLDLNNAYEQLNNPDTSSTLSTLSTRSLGATTEQPTVTRSLETETITLKKCETEPIEDKTELPTILDEEAEKTETTDPEESDGTDER